MHIQNKNCTYWQAKFTSKLFLYIQSFFYVHFCVTLRILMNENQKENTPYGSDGAEHVKYCRPSESAFRKESTKRHRNDCTELSTYNMEIKQISLYYPITRLRYSF